MKKQILKIAGVKSEKEFYKKFPTEEAFMAKHGKELKKAQIGTYMTSESASTMYQPVDVRGIYDEIDYQLTGMTATDRAKIEAAQQAAAQSAQSSGGGKQGGGIDMGQIAQIAQMAGGAKKGKKIPKAQGGSTGTGGIGYPTGPQLTPSAQNLQQQQYNWGTNYNPPAMPAATKKPVNWAQGIPIAGKIIGGIQKSKEAKKLLQQTIQQEKLTDVMGQAAASRPKQQPRRQYVRPEDMAFQPEQMFPSYGVGTNVLAEFGASVGGGEIANTYAPGTLYDNLGYEPLNDSERYKQFYHGGKMHKAQDGFEAFMNQQGGNEIFGAIDQLGAFNDGGGDIGSGIGEALGSIIPIPGAKPVLTALGRIAGSALDQKAEKTEASQERRTQNINKIAGQNFGIGIQQQFGANMEDGGILKAQSGKDLTKKDGKCEAEEARNRADRAQSKVDAKANAAWDREVARDNKEIVRQNAQRMADYLSEGLTGYGDKIKKKDFEAAYQTFATQNPELAKDRLLYTLANKELNKVRNNPDYLMRHVFRRTDPNLDYKTLTLPQLMQTMQKGYGSGQGYYDAWKEGFPMRQSAIQQVVPIQQENGGQTSPYKWVSHTWQPQVIASFGGHNLKDLLKPPHDADMLRAGGHLKAYTPPSAEAMSTERPNFQLGGELQTHWGGYAEPMSYNPYMPGTGETVMFRGQSHDESDGKGNTGIGITYGENPVEVERGEPMFEMEEGGEIDPLTGGPKKSGVVLGNIKITSAFADMLADSKAKGKKFKTYGADLSKQENKQNKLINKSVEQLDDLDVQTSFDKLALGTLQANIEGANAKLKDLAEKKMNAAALQNAINDTKEEDLLEVTDKGDVLAKKGVSIPKAQKGISAKPDRAGKSWQEYAREYNAWLNTLTPEQRNQELGLTGVSAPVAPAVATTPAPATVVYDNVSSTSTGTQTSASSKQQGRYKSKYGFKPWPGDVTTGVKNASEFTAQEWDEIADRLGFKGRGNREFQEFLLNNPQTKPIVEARHQQLYKKPPFIDNKLGYGWSAKELKNVTERKLQPIDLGRAYKGLPPITLPTPKQPDFKGLLKKPTIVPNKRNAFMDIFNQVLPYLRPSDAEALDPNQLIGELYALSTNQLEPVQAQTFQPQLSVPYDISLQDILNENEASYRSQQRMIGYNPAAQSQLNAQKYQANQRVLGEQFRLNQAEKQRVYEQNRNILNQSQLQNLGILDQQYVRQAQALSNTKATTQAALSSIASKYAQNKLENRTLATYENMYNYRFDPRFRAVNMNPLTQWDTTLDSASGGIPQAPEGYEYETVLRKKNSSKTGRNGAILKAIKNL